MMDFARIFFVCACVVCTHTRRAWASASADSTAGVRDYCEHDFFFKPECGERQIILVSHARYGRMREGRCIVDRAGALGCSTDARDLLNRKCSGKRSCEVLIVGIPHALFGEKSEKRESACSSDLRGYLEVAYDCIEVTYPPRGYCLAKEVIEVRQPHGYLSSAVTQETGCGTNESPWWITAQAGQQLRIKLISFASDAEDNADTDRVYGVLEEESEPTTQMDITRERLGYTSSTNKVKVTLNAAQDMVDMSHFLLQFQAIGCPDLTAAVNGWLQREGDVTLAGCNSTGERWSLRCQEDHWVGDRHNCTSGELHTGVPATDFVLGFFSRSKVLYITVAVGIAILIGFCLLVIGLVYICRRRGEERRRLRSASSEPQKTSRGKHHSSKKDEDGEDYYCEDLRNQYRGWQVRRPRAPTSHTRSDVPLHAPPPPPTCTPSRNGTLSRGGGADADHVYERPTFLLPPGEQQTDAETPSECNQDYELYVNENESTRMNSV